MLIMSFFVVDCHVNVLFYLRSDGQYILVGDAVMSLSFVDCYAL